MKFLRVPVAQAEGHLLGQNISLRERRLLRKGTVVGSRQLAQLTEAHVERVYIAQLEPGDVSEDRAALAIAQSCVEASAGTLQAVVQQGGRVSLAASCAGLFRVDAQALLQLNLVPGVSLAVATPLSEVQPGQRVGTLKVIPFALPAQAVDRAASLALGCELGVARWTKPHVALLVTGQPGREEKLVPLFTRSVASRLERWGNPELSVRYVALHQEPQQDLANAIARTLAESFGLILLAGESPTMDVDDVGPEAIRSLGGEVDVVGAPVFPGNLLLIGRCRSAGEGGPVAERIPIVGVPGCARSVESNVIDLVLPRMLAGLSVGKREVAEMGCGGFLSPVVPRADERPTL